MTLSPSTLALLDALPLDRQVRTGELCAIARELGLPDNPAPTPDDRLPAVAVTFWRELGLGPRVPVMRRSHTRDASAIATDADERRRGGT